MDIPKLIQKYKFYQETKQQLEATKDTKIAEIIKKVETYRAELLEQVEAECSNYKANLEAEFDKDYQTDLTKVSNYIELLKELIEEARTDNETDTETEEEKVNEDDRDDNSVL